MTPRTPRNDVIMQPSCMHTGTVSGPGPVPDYVEDLAIVPLGLITNGLDEVIVAADTTTGL